MKTISTMPRWAAWTWSGVLTASGPPIYCIFSSPGYFLCNHLFNHFRKDRKSLVLAGRFRPCGHRLQGKGLSSKPSRSHEYG